MTRQRAPDRDQSLEPSSTVLLVEDEALLRTTLAACLRECGLLVIDAADVAGAITVLRAGPRIDLLFTDVQLSRGAEGVELARFASHRTPRTRVMLVTGGAPPTDADGALEPEVLVLREPYHLDDLLQHVRRLLGMDRSRRG